MGSGSPMTATFYDEPASDSHLIYDNWERTIARQAGNLAAFGPNLRAYFR
jgi:hypothetical protein